MVTFDIIEDLEEGPKYKVGRYVGNSLWLADDTTIIANCKENLKENINILEKSYKKKGLKISRDKSKILRIRGKDQEEYIDNLEVVKEVKYLGIKLGGRGRNIYAEEKK